MTSLVKSILHYPVSFVNRSLKTKSQQCPNDFSSHASPYFDVNNSQRERSYILRFLHTFVW